MTRLTKTAVTEPPATGWIDRFAPIAMHPYLKLARLDRPIGIWLLLFPCIWSVALASDGAPDLSLLLLFTIGAVLMRSAGCTLNDIVDRDFDARVERTRTRPLAMGTISLRHAYGFLGVLLLLGLGVLLFFNPFTIFLGIASLGLVAIYPFAKRVTHWPQAVLGLTFTWGTLLGWTAVKGSLEITPLLLYAGAFMWTLGYDTIYAHQDKEDDLRVGVKSTAIRLGKRTKLFLFLFYGTALLFFAAAGEEMGLGWPFHAGLALLGAHFFWQVVTLKIDQPDDCLSKFRSNQWVGAILALAIVAGKLLP